MKKIIKTKKERPVNLLNTREKDKNPFNWCDEWCEKCDKTHSCEIYRDEQERAVEFAAMGQDPEDMEALLEDVGHDLEILCGRMDQKKNNKKWNKLSSSEIIKELKNLEKTESGRKIEIIPSFSLNRVAEEYARKAEFLIAVLVDRMFANSYLAKKIKDDVEVISWYHNIIPRKVGRVVEDLWEAKIENIKDKMVLKDAYWTAEIIFKAITLSKKSLDIIVMYEAGSEKETKELVEKLTAIEDELIRVLDTALGRNFKLAARKKILEYSIINIR